MSEFDYLFKENEIEYEEIFNRYTVPFIEKVKRLEDMSAVGGLRLMLDGDGDVIVSVEPQNDEGLVGDCADVEFCTIGTGGGGSPRTHKALRILMLAMHLDNEDKNRQGRKSE